MSEIRDLINKLSPQNTEVTSQSFQPSVSNIRDRISSLEAPTELPEQQFADRNALMEVPMAVTAGVTDLAEQFARAYQGSDIPGSETQIAEPDVLGHFANWIIQNKPKFEKSHPYIYAPVKDESTVRGWVRQGIRAVPPSVGASIPGAIAGSMVAPGPGTITGAVAGYAIGGGTIFGMAEYNKFIHDVQEFNRKNPDKAIPKDIYLDEALKAGVVQGGLEFVNDAIEAGTFGVGKLITTPMKTTIKEILNQGWKKGATQYLKRQAILQPSEVSTEMSQSYMETKLRNDIGLDPQDPIESAFAAIGPTVVSTLVIGAGFQALDTHQRNKVAKALTDPEVDFDHRFSAAKIVYDQLKTEDKKNGTNFANTWGEVAQYKIINNQPILLDEDLTTIKNLETRLGDESKQAGLETDVAKFEQRGVPVVKVENIPTSELPPANQTPIIPTGHTLATRDFIFKNFLKQGFSEDRANELSSKIMGIRGAEANVITEQSPILDESGKNIEKIIPQESTSETINLSPGQNILSKIPETLLKHLVFTSKGKLFSTPGSVKAYLKRQGISDKYAPLQLSKDEYVGAPKVLVSMTHQMKELTGKETPVLTRPTILKQPDTEIQPEKYSQVHEDDLTYKGKPFTNKVSAMRAITRHQKEFNVSMETHVPVQIGEKQWVGRRKQLAKPEVKQESARSIINRRNSEYLEATRISMRDGLSKLDEIIENLKEEGHEGGTVFKQLIKRREMIERNIKKQEAAATLKEEVKKDEGTNKQGMAIKVKELREKLEQTRVKLKAAREARKASAVVQEPKEQTVTRVETPVGEKVSEIKEKVKQEKTSLKERIYAKAIVERLRKGEDVADELVNKFPRLAKQWQRNPETNKWEETKPAYLKPKITPEEREKRQDIKAVLKAEAKEKSKQKTPEVDITKNPLFSSPQQTQEYIDNFTALEPDTGRRMLRRMHPINMPNALLGMINHVIHTNDGTVDLDTVNTFIGQLQEAVDKGKLDNYFDTIVDLNLFKKRVDLLDGYLNSAKDYIIKHQKELAIKREESIRKHNEEIEKLAETDLNPIEVTDDDLELDVGPDTGPLAKIRNKIFFQRQDNPSLVSRFKGPLSLKQVQGEVNLLSKNWHNKTPIIVTNNRQELYDNTDETMQDWLIRTGPHRRIGGIYWQDTMFLIADELKSIEELHKSLLHEMIGHHGIIKTLGEKFWPTAREVYDKHKDTELMVKIERNYPEFDTSTDYGRAMLGGEYIARMAELPEYNPTFWDNLIQKIKEILNDLGFKVGNLPDAQIKALLADSKKFVEGRIAPKRNIMDYVTDEDPQAKREIITKPRGSEQREARERSLTGYEKLETASETIRGYDYKDYKKVWIPNPKHELDATQPASIKVDKIIAHNIVKDVHFSKDNKDVTLEFEDGDTRTIPMAEFEEIRRKQKAVKEREERKRLGPLGRRIVDFSDIDKNTPKQEVKELFTDQAYAIMKSLSMQLPKNQPSLHWAGRYLLSPEFYDHPTIEKIVKAAIARHDRYYEIFNDLNGIDYQFKGENSIIDLNVQLKHKGLSKVQILKGETSKEYQDLERMKDEIDTGEWREGYPAEKEVTWEQHFREHGISKDTIDLYKLHREAYDKALDLLIAPMQKLVAEIDRIAERDKTKPKYPTFTTLDENGQPTQISLKDVMSQMGHLRGTYAPRIREAGDYVIKGKRFNKVVRYHKPNRVAAELLKKDLERKGYKVEEIHERERLPEDVYATLRIINTQKAIETAMKGMTDKDIDPDLLAKFDEELIRNVADLLRMRGLKSSMITRKGGDVIRGYITDPNERFVRYINNISAGIAKGEAAREMFGLLSGHYEGEGTERKRVGGIDPSKEHRAYNTATKYIEEQLRNTDTADRIVGLVKSIATVKYLGLNLRSLVVNVLSLVTTVPTAIHVYALDGKGSFIIIGKEIAKAANDYAMVMAGKAKLNKDEQEFMNEIRRKGYDTPQYARDALGTIQRTFSKAWSTVLTIAMYPFGKSEQWIRGTTMLAAYRMIKDKNKNMEMRELMDRAHHVSDRAHGVYGKSTQLAAGQGTGPGARLVQLMYTYQKFGHTYLQVLYDASVRKGNIKSFMFGLLAPVVIGGAMVFPFKDLLFKLFGVILGMLGFPGDPEKNFWDWLRKEFGTGTERVVRHGALGAANLDVSGSLSIGVGVPRDFYELLGVGGGVLNDYLMAKHFLEIGQPGRAIEKALPVSIANSFRAIRELNGITTSKGQRVWDEKGQPYIPSGLEVGLRVFGFRSAEQATMGERTWETKREIAKFKTERDNILEAYRDYIVTKGSNKDLKEIMDRVNKFNMSIIKAKKVNQIPLIKRDTFKRQIKSLTTPNKYLKAGMFE